MASKEFNQDSLQKIIAGPGHEAHLVNITKKDPGNIFCWMASYTLSQDLLMQGYYLEQMMEHIKQKGDVSSYRKGLYCTHQIGRVDLNRKLADELIRRHPIAGRFCKVVFYDWFD